MSKETTRNQMYGEIPAEGFVRLSRLVGKNGLIPVSRTTWYEWIAEGRVPAPIKLGPRAVAYRASTVRRLIAEMGGCRMSTPEMKSPGAGESDCKHYRPPDPIATLLDLCWVQAANFSHCQTERDRRVAFRAVVEERLRGIPGVASLILDDLEARR